MSDDIRKAQQSMRVKVASAEKRHARAQERIARLQQQLSEAESDLGEIAQELLDMQARLDKFLELFPEELVDRPKRQRKVKRQGDKALGRVTMIDAMRYVMGDKVMTAGEIEDALKSANLDRKSNNLRAYISTLLSSQTQPVLDSNGKPEIQNGVAVTAKVFAAVERGRYRVAIPLSSDDSEVLVASTSATDILASQGIDITTINA